MKKVNAPIKENKINVLHLLSSFSSGGIERLIVDMVKCMLLHDFKVNITVIVMNDFVDVDLKKELLHYCSKVYFFYRKEGHLSIRYIKDIYNIVKKHDIQIIHAHNTGAKYWAASIKLLVPKIKLFFSTHTTEIKKNKISRLNLFLHKRIADCNIAVSKAVFALIEEFGFKNPYLIYNGIDLGKFSRMNNISHHYRGFVKIINVARVDHFVKGQDILLKAVKIVVDKGYSILCTFVGNNDGIFIKSYNHLICLAKELGICEFVNFLGDRKDISNLLHQHDIFILPSRYEGLGIAILEALASGIPVIASNLDGPSELIQNGENGLLFDRDNAEDLAEKILLLINNLEKTKKLICSGFNSIKCFDIADMCRSYEKVYRDYLHNNAYVGN